jgi:hypothetical protein
MTKREKMSSDCDKKDIAGVTCVGSRTISRQEHEERVIAAIRRGANGFIKVNSEKICNASKEECAYRSYMTGMIDMLSFVRNALGYWGAEQVREELERWSVVGEQQRHDAPVEGALQTDKNREQTTKRYSNGDVGTGDIGPLTRKGRSGRMLSNDPMFA